MQQAGEETGEKVAVEQVVKAAQEAAVQAAKAVIGEAGAQLGLQVGAEIGAEVAKRLGKAMGGEVGAVAGRQAGLEVALQVSRRPTMWGLYYKILLGAFLWGTLPESMTWPRPCSSVGRASKRSLSGATLLTRVQLPVVALELGKIVDEKYLATPSV